VDPEEATVEDSLSRVNDSTRRLRQPEDHTLMATSGLLPAVPTSTELIQEHCLRRSWSKQHGTDADGNSMAVVSVPGDEADGPTSTGEGAAGPTRTRTRDSDGGASSEQENSGSRLIRGQELLSPHEPLALQRGQASQLMALWRRRPGNRWLIA
jgi:hypothetical protein